MMTVEKLYTKYFLSAEVEGGSGTVDITAKVGKDSVTINAENPYKSFTFLRSKRNVAKAVIGLMAVAVELPFVEWGEQGKKEAL